MALAHPSTTGSGPSQALDLDVHGQPGWSDRSARTEASIPFGPAAADSTVARRERSDQVRRVQDQRHGISHFKGKILQTDPETAIRNADTFGPGLVRQPSQDSNMEGP